MEINKVQWRMIAKGAKLPCDSFLMKKDGTMISMVTGAGVTVGQDAYYLPVEELRSFPKEESEDERIRKDIVTYLKSILSNKKYGDKFIEDWIAWLEKQGEQKPTEEYNITGIGSKHAQGKLGEMIKNLKPISKVLEQKPAEWSEDELKVLNEIIEDYEKANKSFGGYQARIYWLKSLKDRVQPQPKQWSEEDEKMIGNIRRIIEQYAFSKSAVDVNGELCEKEFIDADNWLKSLRPQSHWKPSEEQIKALEDFIYHVDDAVATQIAKLIGDLKNI